MGFCGAFAAVFEEGAEQVGGLSLEEAAVHGEGVVQAGVPGGVVQGSRVAGLGVGGGVDEACQAGGVGGAGAHRAGFEGGVEGAAGEAPAAQGPRGFSDGEELGVGGGVAGGLAFVGGDGEDLLSPGHHGPDGDLPPAGRLLRGEQGAAHHGQVGLGGGGSWSLRHAPIIAGPIPGSGGLRVGWSGGAGVAANGTAGVSGHGVYCRGSRRPRARIYWEVTVWLSWEVTVWLLETEEEEVEDETEPFE